MKEALFSFLLMSVILTVSCQAPSSPPSMPTIVFGRTEARVGASAPFTADAVIGYKVDQLFLLKISFH